MRCFFAACDGLDGAHEHIRHNGDTKEKVDHGKSIHATAKVDVEFPFAGRTWQKSTLPALLTDPYFLRY